ncbi:MAG: hypothetical protein MRERV_1c071 [Mycoplasmataceae bacterium RV_VA103A]|nr:MAG: hypothetical protein MRERV_1c071 [Mycoplasmataceae bacterium RV_VA103A]
MELYIEDTILYLLFYSNRRERRGDCDIFLPQFLAFTYFNK